jgi:uncharacterized protein
LNNYSQFSIENIGLSAVTLLLSNGDVMGCSSIVASILNPLSTIENEHHRWKFVFLGSFVIAVNIMTTIATSFISNEETIMLSPSTSSPIAFAIGGLLVGIGTRLGNGCTSGHGVCGLGRFSQRSFIAVLSFLLSGVTTATFISSPNTPWSALTAFLRNQNLSKLPNTSSVLSSAVLLFSAGLALISYMQNSKSASQSGQSTSLIYQRKSYGSAISGALFAIGLGISGMSQTNKVQGFLDLNPLFRNVSGSYDPTLLTVLGSAVPVSALGYMWQRYLKNNHRLTWCGLDWSGIPNRTDIDVPLVIGSIIFGIGWGLVGLCPGPGVWSTAAGVVDIVYIWSPAFLIGSYIGKKINDNPPKSKNA